MLGELKRMKRLAGVVFAGMSLVLVCAAPAFAGVPAWRIASTVQRPSDIVPGGEGSLLVTATNLGGVPAEGSVSPITLRDILPAGLTATTISGYVEVGAPPGRLFPLQCDLVELRCSYEGGVTPYGFVHVDIGVVAAPDASSAVNEVVMAGGDAAAVSRTGRVSIGDALAGAEAKKFGVEDFEMVPLNEDGSLDTQAGSHPFELTTTFDLNEAVTGGSRMAKDLRFVTPPGLVGNPEVIPHCTEAQFTTQTPPQQVHGYAQNECPADTAIGVARVEVTGVQGTITQTITQPLFNLVPGVGEPARFGFWVFGTKVYLDTSIRTGGDYGVLVSVNNIAQLARFTRSQVTFWGVPGDPRHNSSRGWNCLRGLECDPSESLPSNQNVTAFLTLPTSCEGPWRASMSGDSWEEPGQFTTPFGYTLHDATSPALTLDGCNKLNFEPSLSVAPDGQAGSTPTGLTVGLHVPNQATLTPTGLAESDTRDTTVTLPLGVQLNPAAADGLLSCPLEDVGLESAGPSTCPEDSKVATVEIKTPLLPNPLVGAAYLAAQNANPFGTLVALYIVAEDPISGVRIKAAGKVIPDPVTGQLVSTFENTPPLPYEDLRLKFFGTARAPLATPAQCGTYTTTASFTPWAGGAPATSSSSFDIISGPNGSPCANPLPFAPTLTAGTTSIQAGGFSPFTMTMSREDGEQNLQSIQLKMPLGMSGTLATVKLCGEAQANAGTCGPESEIGETIVSVGLGGDPYTVRGGKVYITGPYKGAPFGLSIVNPAKAGPYDLGKVIVRAKIDVDPETAGLTITTDNEGPYKIPTILDGIPLEIKHVNVNINRPGFTFNATNCSPLKVTGSLTSTEGSSSALSVPYQVTNCAVLAFKPKLEVWTSGKTSRKNGASLRVKLGYPAGPYDANIAKVKVELPKALPSRLTTLQKACVAAVFEANPASCPPDSIVGHATATTPVLPVPLSGPAYFVSHGGEAFPSLIIVLQGYGVTVHLVGSTFIDQKTGVTSSTFKTVPDVPVGTFELNLPMGQYSALGANTDLCKKKLQMPTEFVGQNGALLKTSTKINTTECPKAKKAHHKKKHKKAKKKKKK